MDKYISEVKTNTNIHLNIAHNATVKGAANTQLTQRCICHTGPEKKSCLLHASRFVRHIFSFNWWFCVRVWFVQSHYFLCSVIWWVTTSVVIMESESKHLSILSLYHHPDTYPVISQINKNSHNQDSVIRICTDTWLGCLYTLTKHRKKKCSLNIIIFHLFVVVSMSFYHRHTQ
jgi:hypothetical protein